MAAAGVFLLVLLAFTGHGSRRLHTVHASFLEDQLPLKVVVTAPVELLQSGRQSTQAKPVRLYGRQAITVVFSRPVIALGSDFGNADNFGGKVPFNLSCADGPVPAGKFRWVTTTIARFDPDADWPTDLNCDFVLNEHLTAYDGSALQLDNARPVPLTSDPLSMSLGTVMSERAENLTGGLWSPIIGMPDDLLPEVPPDGVVTLSFNYPVNFELLESALQLQPTQGIKLKFSKCMSPWTQETTDVQSTGDDTCVAVSLSDPLESGRKYSLVLPSGSRYSSYTGPTTREQSVGLAGLRSFRLPIRQDSQKIQNPGDPIWDGTSYRRLTLWLPHGLSPNVTAGQLAARISICKLDQPFANDSSCTKVPISRATPVGPAKLQLQVDELQPRQRYRATVTADEAIMDGYGKPLQASSGTWWSLPVYPFLALPQVKVAVFSPSNLPSAWPLVAKGTDNQTTQASAWSFNVEDEKSAAKLVRLMTAGQVLVSDVLGSASQQVLRGNPDNATELLLPLDTTKDVHVVDTCCSRVQWPTQHNVSNNVQLVLRSQLAVTWVVSAGKDVLVWVASTDPDAPGPVEGATAFLYAAYQMEPSLVGSCTTDADGVCAVAMPKPDANNRYVRLAGVVLGKVGSKQGVAFTQNVGTWTEQTGQQYTGALALDRALLRPGDTLHVTGYIAQKKKQGDGAEEDDWSLEAPDVEKALLVIRPGWTAGTPSSSVSVPVAAGYGSVHTTFKVPTSAKMGSYDITLYVPQPPAQGGKGQRRLAQANSEAFTMAMSTSTAASGRATAVSTGFMGSTGLVGAATGVDVSGMVPVASDSLVVSDPRPPTADLTLSAPAWARPNGIIEISLQATSYLGSQVSEAPIEVVWKTAKAKGVMNVTTDSQGAASAKIELGALPAANVTSAGDTLAVEAAWVGPTRERIVRKATVQLEEAARRVVLSRTLDTDVPGLDWGVLASVISNEDQSNIQGVELKITLEPNTTAGASCDITSSCNIVSGDAKSAAQCQLSLPCVGAFILTACTVDEPKACTSDSIGLNSTEWASSPLSSFDEPPLTPNATQYAPGSVAGVSFQNSWGDSASALLVWGNVDRPLKTQLVEAVAEGLVTLPVPLGPECRGGCAVTVLLSVPSAPDANAPPGVPVSKLFDVGSPHTHVLGPVTLEVKEASQLNVSVSVSSPARASVGDTALALVAPGSNASVTVTVTQGGKPVTDAEVTLVAVDKAVLDLVPYPLRPLAASLALDLAAELLPSEADGYSQGRVAPGALEAVFATLMRRLGLDPWLPADTSILPKPPTPYGDLAAVDYTDTAYLNQFTTPITYGLAQSVCGWGGRQCAPRDASRSSAVFVTGPSNAIEALPVLSPSAQEDSKAQGTGGGGNTGTSSSVRVSSNFMATPMFVVRKTTANGAVSADFRAPMNLGTFIVRAYAVSRGVSALGGGESSLVVRRPLSLTASLPRIVRTGDTFLAGVLVTSPGLGADAPSFEVTVQLQPARERGPVRLLSQSNSVKVTLSGKNNQAEARFNMSAATLGTANLQFTATDSAGATDVLSTAVPVLPQQSAVFVATSFALRQDNESESGSRWQEGLQLPAAVPGSGGLELTAGVGYLPAIIAATNAVAAQRATQRPGDPLDATTGLALAIVPPVLAKYKQPMTALQQSNASDGLDALATLTDRTLGLLLYPPARWSYTPNRADIVLNAQAAYLLSGLSYSGTALRAAWEGVLVNVPVWRVAAARQLVQDATSMRNANPSQAYQDWFTQAWVRVVLGAEWQPATCGSAQAGELGGVCTYDSNVSTDLSLAPLLKAAPNASLTVQLLTALALEATGSTKYDDFISSTADAVISSVRVTARTAYVAASPGASGAAPLETQALALRLLVALARPKDAILLQKIAAHLAAPDAASSGVFTSILPPQTQSAWVTALVASSLALYDQAAGSTQPDLSIRATVGNKTVLTANFNANTIGLPLPRSSTPWSQLPSPPPDLTFNVTGKGEVSVSAGLSFVPLKPLPFPTYRGIWVSSVIQATDPLTGQATGPPLQQAPLAALLQVTVQVTSPDDLGAVTVEALTAGGLEPLDPLTSAGSGTGDNCPLAMWAGDAFAGYFRSWWWPVCPAQEIRPARVTWRWQRLMAGTHTVTYSAVAATEGAFQLPPIKASADDQPEVMGMTASSVFTVGGAGSAAVPLSPSPAPKGCAKDCSGHGACNTVAGTCICVAGWTGETCDMQAS